MSISIDIANASEAKELTTIALESKQYWGYSSDFIEMCRDELTLKEADFVNSLILVAKNNEKYCGFVQLKFNDNAGQGELEKLFVAPSFIGQGIGKTLYERAVEHARNMLIFRFCFVIIHLITALLSSTVQLRVSTCKLITTF